MTKFRQCILALGALVGSVVSLSAQTVAEDVLRGPEIQGVVFQNYVGPHKVIESRLAIQGIGTDLGRQMQADGAVSADYGGKYQILRLHDPSADLLSADLLILGPNAGVDHIRNLNWIVSAYLQTAFGYSTADADLVASFVTRYNAFYRGKIDYVKSVYIPAVAAQVTAENVGISTLWSEWAGKTRILIPLRDSLSKGLAGGVNTEEISNKSVVTQMAQEPGAGLDDRKKLADLKEAEIVQEQKAIAQAEAKVPSTPGTTAAGPTLTPPADQTSTTPAAAATTPAAAEKTLPVAEAKKDVAARDAALQAERKDIVTQEKPKTAVDTPAAAVKPASTQAIVFRSKAGAGSLWLVDPATAKVWKRSELNTIVQGQVLTFAAGYLVVAGSTAGANSAVRLVILSKDDASVLSTGADDVLADTPLVPLGAQMLALTKAGTGWVLGAFDANLKLAVQGTDQLAPLSMVVPTSAGILVQTAAGGLIFLDPATLKKKTATEG